jgi:hypothetical protein
MLIAFLAWCDRQDRPATLDRPTAAVVLFGLRLLYQQRRAADRVLQSPAPSASS